MRKMINGYEPGPSLGNITYQNNRYELRISKCEKALLYKRMDTVYWSSTNIEYIVRDSNDFCRQVWDLIERYQWDPSVSPNCTKGTKGTG